MDHHSLKKRTKDVAVRIIKLSQFLEHDHGNTARKTGDQILKSGTGVYANYRAACRCKSPKDFISKKGTVVEEADETLGWLELLAAADVANAKLIDELLNEANEITAIMTASRISAI